MFFFSTKTKSEIKMNKSYLDKKYTFEKKSTNLKI